MCGTLLKGPDYSPVLKNREAAGNPRLSTCTQEHPCKFHISFKGFIYFMKLNHGSQFKDARWAG